MTKYYLLERQGRKWVAVAAITYATPTTCHARAKSDLQAAGVSTVNRTVVLSTRAEGQKNWGGVSPHAYKLQGSE